MFGTARERREKDDEAEKDRLLKKVGQLQMEVDWLKKKVAVLGVEERKRPLEPENSVLSMRCRCRPLSVHRSGIHCRPKENPKRVRSLMRDMGLRAIYLKRRLSIANARHKKHPYLLKGVNITHSDQVWSTDITYIRLPKGFCCLTAAMDWYSRHYREASASGSVDPHGREGTRFRQHPDGMSVAYGEVRGSAFE